jgi:hypothetical protein
MCWQLTVDSDWGGGVRFREARSSDNDAELVFFQKDKNKMLCPYVELQKYAIRQQWHSCTAKGNPPPHFVLDPFSCSCVLTPSFQCYEIQWDVSYLPSVTRVCCVPCSWFLETLRTWGPKLQLIYLIRESGICQAYAWTEGWNYSTEKIREN